jgi:putative transcriptional regulator
MSGSEEATPSLRGRLLVATPSLLEPTFARTVILLLEHTAADGALGVVLNRPSTAAIAEVLPAVEPVVSVPPVVFGGGPVSPNTAIALGRLRPTADAVVDVAGEVGTGMPWAPVLPPLVTVDLDADPALLAAGLSALRVFAGYAGWSAGQLEGEIEEGSWYVVESLAGDAFVPDPDRLRPAVLRRQGWPLAAAAHSPPDPRLN